MDKQDRKGYCFIVLYFCVKLTRSQLSWLDIVNLTQSRFIWEERTSSEKMLPFDQPIGIFLIMINVGGAYTTVDLTTPQQVCLGCVRKQDK